MMTVLARIRVSGDAGGALVIIAAAAIVGGILTGGLDFIKKHFIQSDSIVAKAISAINTLIWIALIVLVVLDLTNVYPLIREILFSIMG